MTEKFGDRLSNPRIEDRTGRGAAASSGVISGKNWQVKQNRKPPFPLP